MNAVLDAMDQLSFNLDNVGLQVSAQTFLFLYFRTPGAPRMRAVLQVN